MSQPFYPCDYTTVKEWSRWICAKELVDYLHERYGWETKTCVRAERR